MAVHKVNIDVVDPTSTNPIAVICVPQPCKNYAATAYEVRQLIQIAKYYVYKAGTNEIINGDNYYDYFPEDQHGGGGGDDEGDDGGFSFNDVNLYDYDGTIVHSYSAADFANLSELPTNPSHDGLTAQGWNWSLTDAKTYVAKYGKLNIGQMYITSDGKTRLYITLTDGRTSPILQLYLNANSTLDIDWGDGSAHSTFTSTSANYKSERHNYSTPGDYVIAITVVNGGFTLQSSTESSESPQFGSSILWNGNNSINSPDIAYNNAIKKVEIGDGVTSIGICAFGYCYSLSSITIPNNVTSIGLVAFQHCHSLSSITIPDSITSISTNAFYNCFSLSSITIPNSVTNIGMNVFENCYSLSSITIPNNVTSIDSFSFRYCYSLSSITIPDNVTSIDYNAFSGCQSLSSITIPNSVTSINRWAFEYCSSLSSITISNNVTGISSSVFQGCSSLSSITIPNSVTSIGERVFENCYSLSYIKFESTTPPTVSNSNAWAGVLTSTKILVPAGTLETYKSATNYPYPSKFTYEEY